MGMHGKWSLDLKGRSGLADFSAEMTSARTALVNAARGLTKSSGARLPQCGSEQMDRERAQGLSPELRDALDPLLAEIESLNARIAEYDRRIERIAQEVHPEVALLRQVKGVGPLISLTFVLTLDDPYRFRRSRDVGCFLGLRPGRRNSGRSEPQLHISKEGDRYLRTLLVQGAHYILGPFGEDRDLRRWGRKLAERGGKNAKKRAVVAVARKLAVLLHKLWVSGEVYEPLRNNRKLVASVA
jgi:transposase